MFTKVNSIDKLHTGLANKRLILRANMEICCSFKLFTGRTFGYSYREVVKKAFQVTCGDPETEVDLILSRAGIFKTSKDIDDFYNLPHS